MAGRRGVRKGEAGKGVGVGGVEVRCALRYCEKR